MDVNESKKGKKLLWVFLGIVAVIVTLNLVSFSEVYAQQSVVADVQITGDQAEVSNIECCFRNAGTANPWAFCGNGDISPGDSYSITARQNYDVRCNFTVTDLNGYQDVEDDGWANATWFRVNNFLASDPEKGTADLDVLYHNDTCKVISGSRNSNELSYECLFQDVMFSADAGNWSVLVNISDGGGTDGGGESKLGWITISNFSGLEQQQTIGFGSMALGERGSESYPDAGSLPAWINNTGNTIIDVLYEGLTGACGDYMCCTVNYIPFANVQYRETADGSDMSGTNELCGQLTESSDYDVDCTDLSLQDCQDSCDPCGGSCESGEWAVESEYWGIIVPDSGVGGTCVVAISFQAEQGDDT